MEDDDMLIDDTILSNNNKFVKNTTDKNRSIALYLNKTN